MTTAPRLLGGNGTLVQRRAPPGCRGDGARGRSAVAAALLLALLALFPHAVLAAEPPAKAEPHTVVLGLTATQLALAAAVGAGIGVTAALVSANAAVGTGISVLAAVYIAHLAAEAAVVGGVYFFWPWSSKPEEGPESTPALKTGKPRVAGLELAGRTRQAFP